MSDAPAPVGKPGAVKTIGDRPAPGARPTPAAPEAPRGVVGDVKAMWGDVEGVRFERHGRTYFQYERPSGGISTMRMGLLDEALMPHPAVIGTPQARDRPGALPVPADRAVSALTKPSVLDKWAADAAGIRAIETGDNVITMFDVIGEDWWTGGGVTAKKVAAQLRAIGDRPVEVQINSPGGDMFEGLAIYNVLREHPQTITIKVMGMAASAASVIAMAGDAIEIGAASFVMIHNCWVTAQGNRHDMAEVAAFLAPFDQAMADVYAARTGRTAAECEKWMDAETYMSGTTAIDRGFADALLAADATKRDDTTKAADRERTAITALELKLVAGGDTRAQAREHITKIKGTPGAVLDPADTPGAGGNDPELMASMQALLDTFRT